MGSTDVLSTLPNPDSLLQELTSLSLDAVIVLLLFGALVWYALWYGKRGIVSLIISLYIAPALYLSFPFLQAVAAFGRSPVEEITIRFAVFLAFLIFVNIVVDRLLGVEFVDRGIRRWFDSLILAGGATILLVSLSYHVFSIAPIYDFGSAIDGVFSSEAFFFWWLLVPLIIIFLTSRR